MLNVPSSNRNLKTFSFYWKNATRTRLDHSLKTHFKCITLECINTFQIHNVNYFKVIRFQAVLFVYRSINLLPVQVKVNMFCTRIYFANEVKYFLSYGEFIHQIHVIHLTKITKHYYKNAFLGVLTSMASPNDSPSYNSTSAWGMCGSEPTGKYTSFWKSIIIFFQNLK